MQAQIELFFSVKLIKYLFSPVNVVSSNSCVGHLPRIKISFFLRLTCTEELISTPKIMQFPPNPLPIENFPVLSKLVPYTAFLYLSILAFFVVTLTAPSEQFSNVG